MGLHFDEINGVVGWFDTSSREFDPELCEGCGQPFTMKAWNDRHWFENDDYHDHCCPLNEGDNADDEHGNFAELPRSDAQVIAMGYKVTCPVCAFLFIIIAMSDEDECPACGVLLDTSGGIHAYD